MRRYPLETFRHARQQSCPCGIPCFRACQRDQHHFLQRRWLGRGQHSRSLQVADRWGPLGRRLGTCAKQERNWSVTRLLCHSLLIICVAAAGSSQKTPTALTEPCEFDSCPAGSPAVGHNASEPRLNYVNSYPVTSMKCGINSISPRFFDDTPDLAVAGPNVSLNQSETGKAC